MTGRDLPPLLAVIAIVACSRPGDALLAIRDRGDAAAMRRHGWRTWAPAVWERWTPSERLFAEAAPAARPQLRTPRPFRHGDVLEVETLPVMFDVLFDPHATAHIRSHALAHRQTLAALRELPAFPSDAIAVKLVWYPIRARGLTAMPIWDGEPPSADGNPDRSWHRAVAVDPSRKAIPDGETANVELAGRRLSAHVVPLSDFISHRLETQAELASARTAARDPTLERGDAVALVAAHVATKEIPDWVWVTFWWHDRPDAGPFAADRLPGVATHYLMDVAFSTDHSCFNPWLEARFPSGTRSNCVTCHQRAVVGATDYLPVTEGRLRADDPYFTGHPQTDFVWSVALEAR